MYFVLNFLLSIVESIFSSPLSFEAQFFWIIYRPSIIKKVDYIFAKTPDSPSLSPRAHRFI